MDYTDLEKNLNDCLRDLEKYRDENLDPTSEKYHSSSSSEGNERDDSLPIRNFETDDKRDDSSSSENSGDSEDSDDDSERSNSIILSGNTGIEKNHEKSEDLTKSFDKTSTSRGKRKSTEEISDDTSSKRRRQNWPLDELKCLIVVAIQNNVFDSRSIPSPAKNLRAYKSIQHEMIQSNYSRSHKQIYRKRSSLKTEYDAIKANEKKNWTRLY